MHTSAPFSIIGDCEWFLFLFVRPCLYCERWKISMYSALIAMMMLIQVNTAKKTIKHTGKYSIKKRIQILNFAPFHASFITLEKLQTKVESKARLIYYRNPSQSYLFNHASSIKFIHVFFCTFQIQQNGHVIIMEIVENLLLSVSLAISTVEYM